MQLARAAGETVKEEDILMEGERLGPDGRAKSLERCIMGSKLHEKVLCVPALGIHADGCEAHCFPKAAVPGVVSRA